MTQDRSTESESAPPRPRRGGLLIAGAVGACVLGAGLGHWARPGAPPAEPVAKPLPPPPPSLKIVVAEDPHLPVGAPLEVLAPQPAPAHDFWRPRPRPAPFPLLRVDAPASYPSAPAPAAKPTPEPRVERAAAKAGPETTAKPKPLAKLVKVVKAEARELAHPKAQAKVAKAPAKPKAERTQLAKAEPKAPTVQKTSHRGPPAQKAPIEKAVIRKAPAAKPVAKPAAQKAAVTRSAPFPAPKVAPRGDGSMRVARAEPCALADPGAALVCSDRRLGARDRQLQQAYRNAEAAGVPDAALRRQQARWLQARAAAARDAPWAVEDVYVARISELNELARDARDN